MSVVPSLPAAISRRDRRLLERFGITSQLQINLIKLKVTQVKKTDQEGQRKLRAVQGLQPRNNSKTKEKAPLACAFCTYTCPGFSLLNVHMRKHTGERPYNCSQCSHTSITSSGLRCHINLHHKKIKPEKKWLCQLCSKGFTTSQQLDSHILGHTGERPYACQFCQQGYTIKSKQSRHEGICKQNPLPKDKDFITKLKPFKCDLCSYSARENNKLKLHQMSHSGEKPFQCSFCNYQSSFLGNVRRHESAHRGDQKRYVCSKCPYKTLSHSNVKSHLRCCKGEKTASTFKPFLCTKSNCKAAFKTKRGLRQHDKTHSASRPFQCPKPNCSLSFLKPNKLAFHLTTFHDRNKSELKGTKGSTAKTG